jgi:signal transduction histidine kinase
MESGDNLMIIVNDIMDLSMMEAGQMKIRKDQFSIQKLFKDLVQEFGKKAVDSGLELHINIPSNCDDVVIDNDVFRIRQILNNLIGNAIKFTSKGFIEIGYRLRNNFIEFHIKDSGIGIATQYHHTIFERFRQVDSTNSRNFGGNGLGLAISKNLVKMLGGEIWVESEGGKGSTFYFTIHCSVH